MQNMLVPVTTYATVAIKKLLTEPPFSHLRLKTHTVRNQKETHPTKPAAIKIKY